MTEPLPPSDLDAERGLLGAVMRAPKRIPEAADWLTADDFYRHAHRRIYAAILAVRDADREVDPITVAEQLGEDLERCGGAPYLLDLYQTGAVANVAYYAQMVAGTAVRRRLLEATSALQDMAHRDTTVDELPDLLEQARAVVDRATTSFVRRGDDDGAWIGELTEAALKRYAEATPPALPTGFADLDELLDGGLRPGTFTVLAARPGVGKSTLGLNFAVNIATNVVRSQGCGALFVSLEMSREELTDRVLAQVARVSLRNLSKHQLTEDDWEKVRLANLQLRDTPLRIENPFSLTPPKLRSLARDHVRGPAKCGIVVVDYVQLMKAGERSESRQVEVTGFSQALKLLGRELDVPVVAAAQLNREVEKRQVPRPILADLRESGSLEQDADGVIFLWDDDTRPGERQLALAKHRQGPTGDVRLVWRPDRSALSNYSGLRAV